MNEVALKCCRRRAYSCYGQLCGMLYRNMVWPAITSSLQRKATY